MNNSELIKVVKRATGTGNPIQYIEKALGIEDFLLSSARPSLLSTNGILKSKWFKRAKALYRTKEHVKNLHVIGSYDVKNILISFMIVQGMSFDKSRVSMSQHKIYLNNESTYLNWHITSKSFAIIGQYKYERELIAFCSFIGLTCTSERDSVTFSLPYKGLVSPTVRQVRDTTMIDTQKAMSNVIDKQRDKANSIKKEITELQSKLVSLNGNLDTINAEIETLIAANTIINKLVFNNLTV